MGRYRGGGRPPLVPGERAEPLSTCITRAEYEAVCILARQSGLSLSSYTRRVLTIAIRRGFILKTTEETTVIG